MEKSQKRHSLIIQLVVCSLVVIPVVVIVAFAWSWDYCVKQLTSVPRAEVVRFVTEDALKRMKDSGYDINAKVIDVLPHRENLGHLDVALLAGGKASDGRTKLIEGIYELGCKFGVGPQGQSKVELVVNQYREYPAKLPGTADDRK